MKLLPLYFCIVFTFNTYSQEYADTTLKKTKQSSVGISFSNQLNRITDTRYLISEHSLNFAYKYDIIYVSIGVSFTNKTDISTVDDRLYNLTGVAATFGLQMYNYKNKLIVPFNMHFAYYPRTFIDRGGLTQHFTLKSPGINIGAEYRPFKPRLFIYAAFGPTYLSFRNKYRDFSNRYYDMRNGGFEWSLDCGIKYFFKG